MGLIKSDECHLYSNQSQITRGEARYKEKNFMNYYEEIHSFIGGAGKL